MKPSLRPTNRWGTAAGMMTWTTIWGRVGRGEARVGRDGAPGREGPDGDDGGEAGRHHLDEQRVEGEEGHGVVREEVRLDGGGRERDPPQEDAEGDPEERASREPEADLRGGAREVVPEPPGG